MAYGNNWSRFDSLLGFGVVVMKWELVDETDFFQGIIALLRFISVIIITILLLVKFVRTNYVYLRYGWNYKMIFVA